MLTREEPKFFWTSNRSEPNRTRVSASGFWEVENTEEIERLVRSLSDGLASSQVFFYMFFSNALVNSGMQLQTGSHVSKFPRNYEIEKTSRPRSQLNST